MHFRSTFVDGHAANERHPKVTIRKTIITAAALFGAVILGLLGTGGTYAYLNAASNYSTTAITAGSMGLTVSNQNTQALDAARLLPGQSAYVAFDLSNVGDVPASVTGAVTVDSNFSLSLAKASCGALPSAQPFQAVTTSMSFAQGETASMCLRVQLSESAPTSLSEASTPFTLSFTSTQVVQP